MGGEGIKGFQNCLRGIKSKVSKENLSIAEGKTVVAPSVDNKEDRRKKNS